MLGGYGSVSEFENQPKIPKPVVNKPSTLSPLAEDAMNGPSRDLTKEVQKASESPSGLLMYTREQLAAGE